MNFSEILIFLIVVLPFGIATWLGVSVLILMFVDFLNKRKVGETRTYKTYNPNKL